MKSPEDANGNNLHPSASSESSKPETPAKEEVSVTSQAETSSGKENTSAPSEPLQQLPKPAAWKNIDPIQPWYPFKIEGILDFSVTYRNNVNQYFESPDGWCIAGATRRGKMHANDGTFRQDAFSWRNADRFNIYCVCDGAGSSKLSHVGSECTTRWLRKYVGDQLLVHETAIQKCSPESLIANLHSILNNAVSSVSHRLISLANRTGHAPKDFRCTVLLAIHYRHPSGGIYVFGQVGDGFIAIKKKGQPMERIGTSDSGAFSGEVLCFMPDSKVGDFFQKSLTDIAPVPDKDVEAIILCTDGVEDPFHPVQRTISDVFEQIKEGYKHPINGVAYSAGTEPASVLRAKNPGEELLKWLGYEKRGENDDRTLLLVFEKKSDFMQVTKKETSESSTKDTSILIKESQPPPLPPSAASNPKQEFSKDDRNTPKGSQESLQTAPPQGSKKRLFLKNLSFLVSKKMLPVVVLLQGIVLIILLCILLYHKSGDAPKTPEITRKVVPADKSEKSKNTPKATTYRDEPTIRQENSKLKDTSTKYPKKKNEDSKNSLH